MNKKVKRRVSLFILAIFTFLLMPFKTFVAFAEENRESGMNIEAKSAILLEPTSGTIIYEKNPDEKYAPASVTKVMTMLLAMEAVDSGKIKLEDKITCSENAKKMGGSTMLLDTGEVRTVEEILKGIAIASGNDAAVAMAEYLGGTEEDFVNMMNTRAQELGMKNTQFKNCNGLPAQGHYSTARDIATMSMEILKHPTILKYSGIYMETISEGRKSPIELVNHNKLVRFFPGCDGLKTGYTEEAKYCISATATREGVRMLTVIMGAPTFKIRNRDAGILMNHGFSKYEGKKLCAKDGEVEKVQMGKQTDKYFIAKAKNDLIVVMPKGTKEEVTKKVLMEDVKKSYKAGDIVGKVEVYLGEKKVGEVEIYSDRDIEKPGIFENIKYNIKNLFDKGEDEAKENENETGKKEKQSNGSDIKESESNKEEDEVKEEEKANADEIIPSEFGDEFDETIELRDDEEEVSEEIEENQVNSGEEETSEE